jgi:hypothetical protein
VCRKRKSGELFEVSFTDGATEAIIPEGVEEYLSEKSRLDYIKQKMMQLLKRCMPETSALKKV